jgi:hypothetical protein
VTRLRFPVLGSAFLSGCTLSPSIAVLGAYFPDWLFCIVGATCATVAFYAALARRGRADKLGPVQLVYPTLLVLFSLVGWLVFFRN